MTNTAEQLNIDDSYWTDANLFALDLDNKPKSKQQMFDLQLAAHKRIISRADYPQRLDGLKRKLHPAKWKTVYRAIYDLIEIECRDSSKNYSLAFARQHAIIRLLNGFGLTYTEATHLMMSHRLRAKQDEIDKQG